MQPVTNRGLCNALLARNCDWRNLTDNPETMRNEAEIRSDGTQVYLISRVRANLPGKLVLTIVNIAILVTYIYFLSYMQKHHIRAYLVPAAVAFVVLIFFPWRWWFWSFFGKECVTISADSLSYYYNYGIVKTRVDAIPHLRLTIKYKHVKTIGNEQYGRLRFISLNRDNAQHQEIYHTSIVLPKKDLMKIQEEVLIILNNTSGQLMAAAS